jgi:hypothetical protein
MEIFFFYRPKVGTQEVENIGDVQRFYMVTSPEDGYSDSRGRNRKEDSNNMHYSDMARNEDENSVTSYNNSKNKDSIAETDNNQENDNIHNSSKFKSIDNDLSVKLKKREIEQLGINPDEILEEEQKRQPFCNGE